MPASAEVKTWDKTKERQPSWLICIQVDDQVYNYLCGHLRDIGLVGNKKRERCLPQPTTPLPPKEPETCVSKKLFNFEWYKCLQKFERAKSSVLSLTFLL